MKNTFLGLGLCLVQLLPLSVRAADTTFPVTYAEIAFGCNADSSPNLNVTPDLNVADKSGEDRVQGLGSSSFSAEGNQIVLNTSDGQKLVIGALASTPTCDIDDAGERPHAGWTEVTLSKKVVMELSHGAQTTLTVTDLATGNEYQFSW
jgi:hypothetical protein